MWTIVAAVACALFALRIVPRALSHADENRARGPLVPFLEGVLARARGQGEPLYDLRREDQVDAHGYLVGREWTAYLSDRHWVTVAWRRCGYRGKRTRYKLTGFLPGGLIAFPSGDRHCEAFWFVGRMRVLEAVLGGVPRDRLVKTRQDRELEIAFSPPDGPTPAA